MTQNVQKPVFDRFDASGWQVGLAVARFNADITEKLLESALSICAGYRIPEGQITVVRVAGSVELPLALQTLIRAKRPNCAAALGAIIRGETAHFDYVAKIAAEGIRQVMLDLGTPIGFGVLTCETKAQAQARLQAGGEAMEAAIQSARALGDLRHEL